MSNVENTFNTEPKMSTDSKQVSDNAFFAFAPAFECIVDAAQRSASSSTFYGSAETSIANIVPRRSLTSLAIPQSWCSMGARSRGGGTVEEGRGNL